MRIEVFKGVQRCSIPHQRLAFAPSPRLHSLSGERSEGPSVRREAERTTEEMGRSAAAPEEPVGVAPSARSGESATLLGHGDRGVGFSFTRLHRGLSVTPARWTALGLASLATLGMFAAAGGRGGFLRAHGGVGLAALGEEVVDAKDALQLNSLVDGYQNVEALPAYDPASGGGQGGTIPTTVETTAPAPVEERSSSREDDPVGGGELFGSNALDMLMSTSADKVATDQSSIDLHPDDGEGLDWNSDRVSAHETEAPGPQELAEHHPQRKSKQQLEVEALEADESDEGLDDFHGDLPGEHHHHHRVRKSSGGRREDVWKEEGTGVEPQPIAERADGKKSESSIASFPASFADAASDASTFSSAPEEVKEAPALEELKEAPVLGKPEIVRDGTFLGLPPGALPLHRELAKRYTREVKPGGKVSGEIIDALAPLQQKIKAAMGGKDAEEAMAATLEEAGQPGLHHAAVAGSLDDPKAALEQMMRHAWTAPTYIITLGTAKDSEKIGPALRALTKTQGSDAVLRNVRATPGIDVSKWPAKLDHAEYAVSGVSRLTKQPGSLEGLRGLPWIDLLLRRDGRTGKIEDPHYVEIQHHIGCLYAHMLQWQLAADNGNKDTFVFEADGLETSNLMHVSLSSLGDVQHNAPEDYDIIFFTHRPGIAGKKIDQFKDALGHVVEIYEWKDPSVGPAGLSGYMISDRFVRKILPFMAANGADMVDAWIEGHLCKPLKEGDWTYFLPNYGVKVGESLLNCYQAASHGFGGAR